MVVPLKLTQFYGHSVPRPRIYPDVKFSGHRIDPPASVNEALLSWASDAHWSMGGLSFKRLRSQGKVEGSTRRLRAFLEDDDDAAENDDSADRGKSLTKEASKSAHGADALKSVSKRAEKKRVRVEVESVEATPARKLRKKEMAVESNDEGSPVFVPATEEKLQKKGKVSSMPADVKGAVSTSNLRRRGLRLPAQEDTPVEVVHATGERGNAKPFSAHVTGRHGLKSPVPAENLSSDGSPAGESGRLTRSAKKVVPTRSSKAFSESGPGSVQRQPRARKVLMRESLVCDGESSESEDDLEAFLSQKDRPLRRSSRRLVKENGSPLQTTSSCGSDSGSEYV
eukprot:c22853_g1_i1 orf=152-1171(+)